MRTRELPRFAWAVGILWQWQLSDKQFFHRRVTENSQSEKRPNLTTEDTEVHRGTGNKRREFLIYFLCAPPRPLWFSLSLLRESVVNCHSTTTDFDKCLG